MKKIKKEKEKIELPEIEDDELREFINLCKLIKKELENSRAEKEPMNSTYSDREK